MAGAFLGALVPALATAGLQFNGELIAPKLEMFTRRRLKWARPLDLPQFNSMPS